MPTTPRESLYNLAQEGERVEIEGTLVYSALKEKKLPSYPSGYDQDPRYRITISDPKVVKGADTELGKNITRSDVSHGFYVSKDGEHKGETMWSITSNSKFPVQIYSKKTGTDSMDADKFLESELAPGQKVSVLFSTYTGKRANGMPYKSGSLDGVVIEDPANIKYYAGGNDKYKDFLGEPQAHAKLSDFAAGKSESTESANDAKPESKESAKDVNDKADNLFDD